LVLAYFVTSRRVCANICNHTASAEVKQNCLFYFIAGIRSLYKMHCDETEYIRMYR